MPTVVYRLFNADKRDPLYCEREVKRVYKEGMIFYALDQGDGYQYISPATLWSQPLDLETMTAEKNLIFNPPHDFPQMTTGKSYPVLHEVNGYNIYTIRDNKVIDTFPKDWFKEQQEEQVSPLPLEEAMFKPNIEDVFNLIEGLKSHLPSGVEWEVTLAADCSFGIPGVVTSGGDTTITIRGTA